MFGDEPPSARTVAGSPLSNVFRRRMRAGPLPGSERAPHSLVVAVGEPSLGEGQIWNPAGVGVVLPESAKFGHVVKWLREIAASVGLRMQVLLASALGPVES